MYDCLRGVIRGERPAASITHEWQVVDDIRDHMLYFLENHDEQRIASDFFCGSAMEGDSCNSHESLLQRRILSCSTADRSLARFKLEAAAQAIERAVAETLADGYKPAICCRARVANIQCRAPPT